MTRPWLIWSILALCALLIVGAMAWSTNKVLDLEARQEQAESEAELAERIRLGLSRMDTAASAVMVLENRRPPYHFKSFFEPEDVFTNQFQEVGKGIVVQASPLLGNLPEFARLHFEIDAGNRSVHSPQVPEGNERDKAEGSGVPREILASAQSELEALRALLAKPSSNGSAAVANLDEICLACVAVNKAWEREALSWNAPALQEVQGKEESVQRARDEKTGQWATSKKFQQDVDLIEKSRRAEVLKKAAQSSTPRQALSQNNFSEFTPPEGREARSDSTDEVPAEGQTVPGPAETVDHGGEASPFQPIWLDGNLMIVREVRGAGKLRYQGVWLKHDELAHYLLETVEDLLPGARLEPIMEISAKSLPDVLLAKLSELSNDPHSLVTFPWRLQAGEKPVASMAAWSPLRVSLLVGWAALLVALTASAVLVRGVMKLSDRRAAFVSSVTHELRTPLTTFHLYSDMLAEGMVKDEAKKKGYLATMRREAERLNHLVENVLAYSQVERGSARARQERISLDRLVSRMESRLSERLRAEGGELRVEKAPDASEILVETDLTAVEQIVFNLVDNACKYGLPEEGERVVGLRVSSRGNRVRLEVCDAGSGIARGDLRRLFRPFHKSACEAAHSKPGVGLGLALSRRLARVLGGDLTTDGEHHGGACFVLELPLAREAG